MKGAEKMKIKSRTMEDQIKWYISAVRGILICNYGFMEDEADRVIHAYKLPQRLEEAPEAQLHMDIEDTAREMRREGFFSCAR